MNTDKSAERARAALERSRDPERRAAASSARNRVRSELGERPADSPAKATRALSWVLDETFRVPGTNFRFGVDPILAFLPAVGSTVGTLFGTVILVDAVRLRAPVSVISRMLFNYLVNWLAGLVPVLGPFVDAWWKSNARNVKLLDRTIADREQVRKASATYWIVLGVMLLLVVIAVVAVLVGGFMLLDSWINQYLRP